MRARVLVVLAAVALGVAAEWAAFDVADVRRWLPDLLVGWVLVGCGLVGTARRPASRTGALLVAAGLTWFLGNFAGVSVESAGWLAGPLVYLHRGFLVHLLLTYPALSASSWTTRVAIGFGYAVSMTPAPWNEASTSVVLSVALWAASRSTTNGRPAAADGHVAKRCGRSPAWGRCSQRERWHARRCRSTS